MNVQQLLELCEKVQDKSLTVMISNNGEFFIPSFEDSGETTFGEPCNEDGSPLSKESVDAYGEIKVFAIMTANVAKVSEAEL